jgi:hypothetical protein
VRCLVGPQPVTMKTIVQRRLALLGVPADRIDDLEQRVIWRTSIGFARRAPQQWARNVRVPTFLYQVHDDVLTDASDVQTMFDNIPRRRQAAPVDPRHHAPLGRLPGIPAPSRAGTRMVRQAQAMKGAPTRRRSSG